MGWCQWFEESDLYRSYHQGEWGHPCHDDRKLFEYLMLECLQCGLSWSLVMRRRKAFDKAFMDWDFEAIAEWDDDDCMRCLSTEGMLNSPRKVTAIVGNARAFVLLRQRHGSFDSYLWDFSDNKVIVYNRPVGSRLPAHNGLSTRIAKSLKDAGFSYVGPTTVYAFLQGVGVICDHDRDCPVGKMILESHPHVILPVDDEVD